MLFDCILDRQSEKTPLTSIKTFNNSNSVSFIQSIVTMEVIVETQRED